MVDVNTILYYSVGWTVEPLDTESSMSYKHFL